MKKTNSEYRSKEYRFNAEDFWKLIELQKFRCALTDRELTEYNTEVEHKLPLRKKGQHEYKNLYMVDKDISHLARHLSEDEIIKIALEIVKHRGQKYGYKLEKI